MFTQCSSAWDEIHEVFGDGHDYDYALVDDEEAGYEEEQVKPEMKYQDVRPVHAPCTIFPLTCGSGF